MERKVVCIQPENGSNYDDCRQIAKVGYELRDGVYERDSEYIHRRIEDGEEFYIEDDSEKTYLQAVSEEGEENEGEKEDEEEEGSEQDDEDEEEEDVRKYVRTADEDTADDPLLSLDSCQ